MGSNKRAIRRRLPLLFPLLLASGACGDDAAADGADAGASSSGASACGDGCDYCVEPGDDDQTAVQTAFVEVTTGQTLCLAAGTFHFDTQLDLRGDDIEVHGAGMDETELDFSKQTVGGNAIAVTGDNTVLSGFTVRDSGGDGIRATDVDGFTVRDVAVLWKAAATANPGYGIYPVGSSRVLVEKSKVCCASDTGIYVGQSSRIVVRDNEVYENVAGIEIENSMDSEVMDNHAHDNSAGIMTFNLPELPVQGGARANIHDNLIENNNHENFAAPGNIVADVPPGLGVMILAADDNEVHDNQIHGNVTTGLLLISYSAVLGPYNDPNFDPFASGNYIHHNTFADNGADPMGLIAALFADIKTGPDISFDGCLDPDADASDPEAKNCISDNGDARFLNVHFSVCGGSGKIDSDPATATCEHDALPPVDLDRVPYARLSDYGFFLGTLRELSPAPELVPFEPASPLWSDNAVKLRFLYVPEGETIGFDADKDWDFPLGTVAIKNFVFPLDRREPDGAFDPIETRLLVRDKDGFKPYVYLWNEERTDAELFLPGKRVTVEYTGEDGGHVKQNYQIPNENQCGNCHERDDVMFLLGVHTRQLNHATAAGENQLALLADAGLFDQTLPPVDELPALADPRGKAPLDARARGWLEANCAHCHRSGGGGGNSGLVLLASQGEPAHDGVCKSPVAAGPASGGFDYDIVPGRPDESIAVFRMESDDPEIRMPELPVLTADPFGTQLVRDWIAAMSPAGCPP